MDPDSFPPFADGAVGPDDATRPAAVGRGDDGPVWTVHLVRHRQGGGRADGQGTDRTGRAGNDGSSPCGPVREDGAELVFLSDVEEQLVGDDQEWERIAVVRHPTRRSVPAVADRPASVGFQLHQHAPPGSGTVLFCRPADWPALPAGAPHPADGPYPSTPDDGPVVLLHLLRRTGERRSAELDVYRGVAGRSALSHGVRIGAWLDVEGSTGGDGPAWDEARFHVFPSRAAFQAVALDPRRIAAQSAGSEPAIADVVTLVLRPLIDDLAASIRS